MHILPASPVSGHADIPGAALPGVVGALGLAVAPQFLYAPLWVSALLAGIAAWRVAAALRAWPLPNKGLCIALALTCLGGIYLQFGTLLGRDPGVALLTILLGMKLLETRTLRDCMLLLFLGYFVIVTTFLYTQSIPAGLYMLIAVLALTGALIHLNRLDARAPLTPNLRLAATLLVQAAPFMLVLFLLFPRVSGSLWGVAQDAPGARSGLSEQMAPGNIGALAQSQEVVLRAAFSGTLPAPGERYWRGPVFWFTDGHTWSAGRAPALSATAAFKVFGTPLSYSVTLEPHQQTWLFALDLPVVVPPGGYVTNDFQLRAAAPVEKRVRYEMRSYPRYQTGPLSAGELRRALQLPAAVNPRARELGESWRRRFNDDDAIAQFGLAYFRSQPFFYTLTPPPLGARPGDNPVDEFLFNTRRGFCEHYAAAYATLMRAAGIPARVVTGYQGGELNPVDDYLIVRQADAHAWVELWLPARGWLRIDPTSAVAPARIERGATALNEAATQDTSFGLARAGLFGRAWLQVRFRWDALNYRWGQWVLGYNPLRQGQLLSKLGLDALAHGTTLLALSLVFALALLFAGFAAYLLLLRPHNNDPLIKLYRRFCAKLARLGVARAPSEGPRDFAARAATLLPDRAREIHTVTALYCALRYARQHPPQGRLDLRRHINAF